MNSLRRLIDNSRIQIIGRKSQYGRTGLGNRFLPMPDVAYEFWNLHADPRFARSYLKEASGQRAREKLTSAVRALVRWQGKERFAAKITGPPRINFLSAVFPDAVFIHVIRDGRAVVHSLLNVAFWRAKGGLAKPFWDGGPGNDMSENPSHDPGILAALQWRDIIGTARQEASRLRPEQYLELRYEDLVADPIGRLRQVVRYCGLSGSEPIERYLDNSVKLSNMNGKYLRDFSAEYSGKLAKAMQPLLSLCGYTSAE